MNKREKSDIPAISASTVILDIEGTTTSISFVKDKLFPYVRSHLEAFLTKNWDSTNVQDVVKALQLQTKEDEEAKLEGVVSIPEDKEKDVLIKSVIDNVVWQMDNDRKTKSLKDLQGLIWEEGYKKDELKGHIYDDVEPCLKSWVELGKSIYIYSSGSVHAQKLLFGHSEKGDLLPFLKGHFDTTVGKKGDAASYKNILEQISCEPSDAAFLTDVPSEARAAKEAGISAVLLSRDGNTPLTDEDKSEFPVVTSFTEVEFENNCKKRKICTENDTENKNKVVEACVVSIEDKNKPHNPKLITNSEVEAMEVDESPEPESAPKKTTEDQAETSQKKEKCEKTECEERKEETKLDVPAMELKKTDNDTINAESTKLTDEEKGIDIVDKTNDTEQNKKESLEPKKVEVVKDMKVDEINTNNEVVTKENDETTVVAADKMEEDAKVVENSETNTAKKGEIKTLDEKAVKSDIKTDNEETISSSNDVKDNVTSSNDVKENISSSNDVEGNISSSNDVVEKPLKSSSETVPIENSEEKTNADTGKNKIKDTSSEETKSESEKPVSIIESSDEGKSVVTESQTAEANVSENKETPNIEDKCETTTKTESSDVVPDGKKAKTEAEEKPDTSQKEDKNESSQVALSDESKETKVPSIQKTEIVEKETTESNLDKQDESNEDKDIPNNKAEINGKAEKEEGKQNGNITNGNSSPDHEEKLTNGDEMTEKLPEGKKCSPPESATLETVVEA